MVLILNDDGDVAGIVEFAETDRGDISDIGPHAGNSGNEFSQDPNEFAVFAAEGPDELRLKGHGAR